MADFSYPDDSCIRLWEDPSLEFSYNLGAEFSNVSDSSVVLVPLVPFSSSIDEVGSSVSELDESVARKFDDEYQTAWYYNSRSHPSDNSEIPHVLADSEAENVESVDSYMEWDENSATILPDLTWPPMDQSVCADCQLLREIIHTNGIYITKLEIHGRNGNIFHAVHLVQCNMDGIQPTFEQEILLFDVQNIEGVKEFLLSYCRLRRKEGFIILQDSLSAFYEAICAGMNETEIPCPAPVSLFDGTDLVENAVTGRKVGHSPQQVNTSPQKSSKSSIAAQRERTGRLQISDLVNYFHLPITVAARELAICPTVLKKICRRNGMRRWPHRKIKSIDRKLLSLENSLAAGNREDAASIRAEIEKLRNERARITASNAAPV